MGWFHSSYIHIKRICSNNFRRIDLMSSSHVDNLVKALVRVPTSFGTFFSTQKKQSQSSQTKVQLHVKCLTALHSCWRTFRSFFSLDQKHSIRDLWNFRITQESLLLLLVVVLFVVCPLISYILTSLLL